MSRLIVTMIIMVFVLGAGSGRPEAPLSLSGFTLGRSIEEYAGRVVMESALPVRYMEHLREVEIVPQEGFKSGLIAYGTCRNSSSIVRIKLKYADGSLDFYRELLKRFKQKFGEPTEYQGDPFGVFIRWKWSFKDSRQNRISLILQHNLKDKDEKIGNAIKLTLSDDLEEDARGFQRKKHHRPQDLSNHQPEAGSPREPLWSRFIPN